MTLIPRRHWLKLGVVLVLFLLLANTFFSQRAARRIFMNEGAVEHTEQVLLQLERVESLLKDAETGQRGYLYTGDAKYLEPYNAAITQVNRQIDELARLTADNPTQQARIADLRKLSQDKLEELEKTVELQSSGQQVAARQVVISDYGKQQMDEIRRVLADLKEEEVRLVRERTRESRRSLYSATLTFILASVVAGIAVILLGMVIHRDMLRHDADLAAIREREEWLRTTLYSIGDAVITTDPEGRVTMLNHVAERIIGFNHEQASGRAITEVFPIYNEQTGTKVIDPVRRVIAEGVVIGLANHTVLRREDGREFVIDDSAAPIRDNHGRLTGVVLVFRDVTDQRRSEAALRKAERLATAGRLSATVAHEINNPLESVTNLLFLLGRDVTLSESAKEFVALAEQEVARVAHIAKQTLTFHRSSATPGPVMVTQLAEEVFAIYRNKIQSKRIVTVHDLDNVPVVEGLAGELRQVFANLVANAIDAVDIGGTIKVSARVASHNEIQGVRVSVEDNGSGIDAESMKRIFEPFFTTKKDVGTGLGLWVTKGVVESHGGTITARSTTGTEQHGTCFEIFLPLNASAAAAAGPQQTSAGLPQG